MVEMCNDAQIQSGLERSRNAGKSYLSLISHGSYADLEDIINEIVTRVYISTFLQSDQNEIKITGQEVTRSANLKRRSRSCHVDVH